MITKFSKKYKISPSVLRKANSSLIKNGISDKIRNSFTGNIDVEYHTQEGIIAKSFTNSDIKVAYEKALKTYAEKI